MEAKLLIFVNESEGVGITPGELEKKVVYIGKEIKVKGGDR